MCKPSSSVEKEASVVGPVPRIVPDHRGSFSLRPVDTKGGPRQPVAGTHNLSRLARRDSPRRSGTRCGSQLSEDGRCCGLSSARFGLGLRHSVECVSPASVRQPRSDSVAHMGRYRVRLKPRLSLEHAACCELGPLRSRVPQSLLQLDLSVGPNRWVADRRVRNRVRRQSLCTERQRQDRVLASIDILRSAMVLE